MQTKLQHDAKKRNQQVSKKSKQKRESMSKKNRKKQWGF